MSGYSRLFVALNLPEPVQKRLHMAAAALNTGRPVPAAQLHVTLRFIGPSSEESFGWLKHQLEKVTVRSLSLSFGKTEWFPPRSPKPHGVWIGLTDKTGGGLETLRKEIEKAVVLAGFKSDTRPFRPHMTLLRFGRADIPVRPDSGLLENEPPFPAGKFTLYASELTPAGAIHTPLMVSADIAG